MASISRLVTCQHHSVSSICCYICILHQKRQNVITLLCFDTIFLSATYHVTQNALIRLHLAVALGAAALCPDQLGDELYGGTARDPMGMTRGLAPAAPSPAVFCVGRCWRSCGCRRCGRLPPGSVAPGCRPSRGSPDGRYRLAQIVVLARGRALLHASRNVSCRNRGAAPGCSAAPAHRQLHVGRAPPSGSRDSGWWDPGGVASAAHPYLHLAALPVCKAHRLGQP